MLNEKNKMENVEKIVAVWKSSLCEKVEWAGLISRNPTAHKWKATYRSIVLRELTFWRVTDLLDQMVLLAKAGYFLGATILLRSTIETLAVLIYLNQKTKAVLEGQASLYEFSEVTSRLILGSKNSSTKREAINVAHTILKEWCERKYPGIFEIYEDLCESAHPNYEGICRGYSYVNKEDYETVFKNRWAELYGDNLGGMTMEFIRVFEEEYNQVWPEQFNKLEKWLEENNEKLQSEIADI